jgi:putative oxidoreductase
MWQKLIRTDRSAVGLVLRLTLGIVIFPHGAQKALGWFGGGGFAGTLQGMSDNLGIPVVLVFLVICAEFLGALGLIVGLLTRVAAFGVGCVMVGAIYLVHAPHGFFMNWYGSQPGEGIEYHILVLGLALAILLKGGGALSIDGALAKR